MSAVVYQLPVADRRLEGMADAPADALALVRRALERTGELADLIRRAAPAAEITAAAEALASLHGPLASLETSAEMLTAARSRGEAEARSALSGRRARLSTVRGTDGTPGGAA